MIGTTACTTDVPNSTVNFDAELSYENASYPKAGKFLAKSRVSSSASFLAS